MNEETNLYDIAVVGMTGRFPGANTVEDFWDNLVAGVESIQRFSDEELVATGIPQELLTHPDYVKGVGVIENIAYFDAAFFGFTPKEATIMNPQQRLFLAAQGKKVGSKQRQIRVRIEPRKAVQFLASIAVAHPSFSDSNG